MQDEAATTGQACPDCEGSDVREGLFCRRCSQLLTADEGVKRAGLGRRFGAWILDNILFWLTPLIIGYIVSEPLVSLTLIIVYIVWWLIVLGRGQTPGKQLLGIRAIREDGQASGWGRTFLRELVYKWLVLGLLGFIFFFMVLDYLWALWDRDRQTLHDKFAGTVVVQGPR